MKDRHRETIPVAEITKIEFKDADIVVFRDAGQKSFRMSETQSFEFGCSKMECSDGRVQEILVSGIP